MVTIYELAGESYAIDVRPDARVSIHASAGDGIAQIVFSDSSPRSLTLILPSDVARQVFGEPFSALPATPGYEDDEGQARHRLRDDSGWPMGGGA